MRIHEFIEKLKQFDQDNYVYIDTPDSTWKPIDIIKTGSSVVSIKVED